MNYIAIDGGTTNTRISLVENGKITQTIKINAGARMGIENSELLKNGVRDAVKKLSESRTIKRILASGMITCEFGLYKLDHILAPAGIKELHDGMCEVKLDDISEIPFVFIPGVKTVSDSLEDIDMMRGEETELMGIIDPAFGKCVYVLPGSHSKLIFTDEASKIVEFKTMLTGEMIASLSQNTILKDAVDISITDRDDEYLLKGYDYCATHGVNETLFKVRILKNILKCDPVRRYSFFIGAVLCDEIKAICSSDAETVVIGGKQQIKEATAIIIAKRSDKKVIVLDENAVAGSTVNGMIKIYEA